MTRAFAAFVIASCAAGPATGCSIDTELGVAVDVTRAEVVASGDAAETVVTVDVDLDIRVGDHAMGERQFVVTRVELFAKGEGGDDEPLGIVNLDRPSDFDGTLAPGESQTVAFHGETRPGAFAATRDSLCERDVTALVRYEDRTEMELLTATGDASVTCD